MKTVLRQFQIHEAKTDQKGAINKFTVIVIVFNICLWVMDRIIRILARTLLGPDLYTPEIYMLKP